MGGANEWLTYTRFQVPVTPGQASLQGLFSDAGGVGPPCQRGVVRGGGRAFGGMQCVDERWCRYPPRRIPVDEGQGAIDEPDADAAVVGEPLEGKGQQALLVPGDRRFAGADQQSHAVALVAVGEHLDQAGDANVRREALLDGPPAQCGLGELGQVRTEVDAVRGMPVGQLPHDAAIEVTAGVDASGGRQPGGKQIDGDRLEPPQDVVDGVLRRGDRVREGVSNDDGRAGGQRIEADGELVVREPVKCDDLAQWKMRQRQRFPACH